MARAQAKVYPQPQLNCMEPSLWNNCVYTWLDRNCANSDFKTNVLAKKYPKRITSMTEELLLEWDIPRNLEAKSVGVTCLPLLLAWPQSCGDCKKGPAAHKMMLLPFCRQENNYFRCFSRISIKLYCQQVHASGMTISIFRNPRYSPNRLCRFDRQKSIELSPHAVCPPNHIIEVLVRGRAAGIGDRFWDNWTPFPWRGHGGFFKVKVNAEAFHLVFHIYFSLQADNYHL